MSSMHLDSQVRHVSLGEVKIPAPAQVLSVHEGENTAIVPIVLLRNVLHFHRRPIQAI